LAELITKERSVPVIGIRADNVTYVQVLCMKDMLGLNTGKKPKFGKNFMAEASSIQEAFKLYDQEVKSGAFPSAEFSVSG